MSVSGPLADRITRTIAVEIVRAVAEGARSWSEVRRTLELPEGGLHTQLTRGVFSAMERTDVIAYDHPGGYTLTEDGHELAQLAEVVPSGEAPDVEALEMSA